MINFLVYTLPWLAMSIWMRSSVHDYIALTLWTMVIISIGLTFSGAVRRSPRLMFVAAAFIVVPGILGIFSIGIFFLMLAVIQVTAGFALRRFADRRNVERY